MKQTNEVSRLAGISKRTLQYYDDEGVLTAKRSKNNYRLYSQDDLEEIWEIMIYKEIGFDLNEIKQLLSMPDQSRHEQLQFLLKKYANQIQEIKEKMDFISLLMVNGMPQLPPAGECITYKDYIARLIKQDSTDHKS